MPARVYSPERAVYFNGLPKHVDREEIYTWAKNFGWVRKLDLPDGYGNYYNKGYAYIHFKKEKEAQAVIAKKSIHWKGHDITVRPYNDTRAEEERVPYKDRSAQVKASNEIMSMLKPKKDTYSWADCLRVESGFATSSQTPTDTSPKRSRSSSGTIIDSAQNGKQPTADEINVAVDSWSRQNSFKIDQGCEEKDELELVPPSSCRNVNFLTADQQAIAQHSELTDQNQKLTLDNDLVSTLYKVLSDEMDKLNAQNGTNLSVQSCPHLVDSYFNQFFQVLANTNLTTV